jgi:hypothetical protein
MKNLGGFDGAFIAHSREKVKNGIFEVFYCSFSKNPDA